MPTDQTGKSNASAVSGSNSPPSSSLGGTDTSRFGINMRASSPAKRSASERDEDEQAQSHSESPLGNRQQARSPKKTYQEHLSPMPSRFKAINGTSSAPDSMSVNVRDGSPTTPQLDHQSLSGSEISGQSIRDTEMSNTSNSSSPPTSTGQDAQPPGKTADEDAIPSVDEQVEIIKKLVNDTSFVDGATGYVVSSLWLSRVIARTTQGLQEGHDKALRDGEVGPVDNSDIVANEDFHGQLKDTAGENFTPLRIGLQISTDMEVVPMEAWELIVKWYGIAEASHVVLRYCRDTSPAGASTANLQYDLYPPIFTVQKVRDDADGLTMTSMQEKDISAVSLVANRSDAFRDFLRRAKIAAGIDMATKVRVWKLVEPTETNTGQSAMPTPIPSRSNSPAPQASLVRISPKRVVDLNAFMALSEGSQRELIDLKDETANDNYNGHFKLGDAGFAEQQTLILEEQVRDSADDFASDKLKKAAEKAGVGLSASASSPDLLKPKASTQSLAATRRSPTPSSGVTTRTNRKGKTRGSTGLNNLGNTCYMNSAMQCIRSVEELSLYFLDGRAKSEINASNPLGHGGSIAKAYEGFLHSLYDADSPPSFAPRNFKNALGRAQPLFSGYGQQDSQEFLSFLVDGLHEDLNRVQKKPYRENPDSDDKTVHDPEAIKALGEKYRENHGARNDSIAMDLFSGFYKNTMLCPVCDKISITFDPYSLLTLQLPIESTFQHQFLFVPLQGHPIYIRVDIDKNSSITMLKEYFAKRVPGTKAENLVVAEAYNQKFYKIFEDADVLFEANIQPNDRINVYELDATPTNWPPVQKKKIKIISRSSQEDPVESETRISDRLAVPVLHRFQEKNSQDFILQPSMILVTKEESRDLEIIFRKVLRSVSVLTTRDLTQYAESTSPEKAGADGDQDDAFVMNVEDTTTDFQNIHASSVAGEDGLVDVTMTGAQDADPIESNRSAASTSSGLSKPSLLDPNHFVDPALHNIFSLQYFTTTRHEPIPCGFSDVRASERYASLESRMPRPASRRTSSSSWTGRRKSSPATSDDELGREDSTSDNVGGLEDTPESDSDDNSNTTKKGRTLGQKFNSARKELGSRFKKAGRRESNVVQQPESLVRVGEGIVVSWNRDGYAQLFEASSDDDLRGTSTLNDIQILEDAELDAKKARRTARKKQGVTLTECFEESSKSEVLSEENAWYCSRCKERRRATKTLEIWTVPDILVVHLKRFSSSSRLRDKVDVFVDFPTEGLDLSGKVGLPEDKSLTYDLFAVDNHYGGLGGGHYTAYAQNFFDKKWYDYNDSMVSPTSAQHAVTKAAYLLFYRRRSTAPLGPPYLQHIVNRFYAGADTSGSRSGEDQRPDGPSSPSGSSGNSLEVVSAAGASPRGAAGSVGGQANRGTAARSALVTSDEGDGGLPAYSAIDEGIGMDDNPDDPLPGLEDRQARELDGYASAGGFVGPMIQNRFDNTNTWSFANLGSAGRGWTEPDNGDDSDATLAGSVEPDVGDDTADRMLTDFGDDYGTDNDRFVDVEQTMPSPLAEDQQDQEEDFFDIPRHRGGVRHVEYLGSARRGSDEVAEVRVSDDEGA